jgi:hypothetical protein
MYVESEDHTWTGGNADLAPQQGTNNHETTASYAAALSITHETSQHAATAMETQTFDSWKWKESCGMRFSLVWFYARKLSSGVKKNLIFFLNCLVALR